MDPKELRRTLLYGDRTKETFAKVPTDARFLFGYLRGRGNETARAGRLARRSLLAAALLAILILDRHNLTALCLLFALAGYEFAYSVAAQVRADHEDADTLERLRISVDEYLSKHYPTYSPPKDES